MKRFKLIDLAGIRRELAEEAPVARLATMLLIVLAVGGVTFIVLGMGAVIFLMARAILMGGA